MTGSHAPADASLQKLTSVRRIRGAADNGLSAQQVDRLIIDIRDYFRTLDDETQSPKSFVQPLSHALLTTSRDLPVQDIGKLIGNIRKQLNKVATTAPRVFADIEASDYPYGEALFFGAGGKGPAYFGTGWHQSEPAFTWSEGLQASLNFQLPPSDSDLLFEFMANGYINPKIPHQDVAISFGGIEYARFPVSFPYTFALPIPKSAIAPNGLLTVHFTCPRRAAPAQFKGRDRRMLGIALHTVTIREVVPSAPLKEEVIAPTYKIEIESDRVSP